MALISGAVIVTGTIAPTDTDDVYATHDSKYGKGGYREVATIADRDSITPLRRTEGMLVYVQDISKLYKLENGTDNTNWVEFQIDAAQVNYDSSGNNLTATNLQDAIDEVQTSVHSFTTKSVDYTLTGGATGTTTVNNGDAVVIDTVVEYAENDFSVGPTTKTATSHSFVTGKYNVAKATSIVEVGIGTDGANTQNAFEVASTGEVSAPSMTKEMIDQPEHLTTKDYIDWLVIDCGLY